MKSAFQYFISYLLCDWVSSIGAIVVTTSAVIFLTFAFESFSNPHYGALTGEKPLAEAPAAVKRIYDRNIYPAMVISWGAYPNNIGHDAFPGGFRCHDDNHKSETGKTISQDCSTCHELLAVAEDKPEILKTLGLR